jgi:hypothetical protein
VAGSSLTLPWPALERAVPDADRAFAVTGDTLILTGHHLDADQVRVRFEHPALMEPVVAGASAAGPAEIRVALPATVPAGLVAVSAELTTAAGDIVPTNPVSVLLAPTITTPGPFTAKRDSRGRIGLDLDVAPPMRAAAGRRSQRVLLLAGDVVAEPAPFDDEASTLSFAFPIGVGRHLLRLRVDDADSPHIDQTVSPPRFIPSQRLTVHD